MAHVAPNEALSGGHLNAAISNMIVRCFSEYTGRGPTRARTSIRDDVIVCILEDTLTKAERTLVHAGRDQLVLDTRRAFQSTMREEMVGRVEELTDRRVIAFMSDNHIDPDIATESFVLEPLDVPGESGAEPEG